MFTRTALLLAMSAAAGGVHAVEFEFNGDLNNRFQLYTNQNNFFNNDKPGATLGDESGKASISDSYGEIKYRLWTTVSSDDENVIGVYAIEVGGVRFGREGSEKSEGGSFSGDGANVETRWAYTEVKLPNNEDNSIKVGLQPYNISGFLWNENATGVIFNSEISNDTRYSVAWIRGQERQNETAQDDFKDVDGFSFRLDDKSFTNTDLGAFILYQVSDAGPNENGVIESSKYGIKQFDDVKFNIVSIGTDGIFNYPLNTSNLFIEWDFIYQDGSIDDVDYISNHIGTGREDVTSDFNDFDLNTFFSSLSLGLEKGNAKYTYTLWYSSGDSNPNDNEMNAFLATDVDRDESVIFFEGGYSDDQIHTERPYFMDKGIFMNRLGVDYQASSKLTVGGALIYFMTSKDIKYEDDDGILRSNSELGTEIDFFAKYKMYKDLEVAFNVGYLMSGDAMDFYDLKRDGIADNDIVRSTARLRYKF